MPSPEPTPSSRRDDNTFCALRAEGAVGDWSAVYLHDDLAAPPALAGALVAGRPEATIVGLGLVRLGGYLAGPLAIGLVADAVGLPAARGLVALACALTRMGAGLARLPRLAAPPALARAT